MKLKIFSMSFNVKTISVFERQAKRLVRKFPSLKLEIRKLVEELKIEPRKGTPLGLIVLRYVWQLQVKGNQGEPE